MVNSLGVQADLCEFSSMALQHPGDKSFPPAALGGGFDSSSTRHECRRHVPAALRAAEEADQLAEPLQEGAAAAVAAPDAAAPEPAAASAAAGAPSPLCQLFAEPTRQPPAGAAPDERGGADVPRPCGTVALVGNAPLDEAQDRGPISGADFIVRFNWMHHRWAYRRVPLPAVRRLLRRILLRRM